MVYLPFSMASETTAQKWKRLGAIGLATGGLSGYLPLAPGTWGSLVAAAIWWLTGPWNVFFHLILCAALLVAGAWASQRACDYWGEQDSGKIVIDEIVGMLLTVIGMPVTGYWLASGFLAFRFFDIVKPPPARFFDSRVHNGWGVMLDDVIAGIYGNILLQLMLRATL